VRELRPRWVLIENVPGLLSSNGGADFAVVLAGLDELGFDAGWAVLDAQHFGVPQRRRRVFVVGGPRGRGAEQVLSLCESCGGNPQTGRAAGQDVAYALAASARGTGDGHGNAWNSTYVANPVGAHHGRQDLDHDTYVTPFDSTQITSAANYSNPKPGDPCHPLAAGAHPPMVAAAGVRRLTPRECERLMSWPDDWTRWAADGSEIADSHRYKMAGNGVVSSVAEWIGHRLMAVAGWEKQGDEGGRDA
jgi:DNA (cytosine-5)-methyltransferase 1